MELKSTTQMERRANITDASNGSPTTKRAKQQPERDLTQITAKSDSTTNSDIHSAEEEHLSHKTTTSTDATRPLKDGIFNFFLPTEEETNPDPVENLEPNSAGLKSSRIGGVWYKSLEESHSAQIKERSLLGHVLCPEETQKKTLESDIFRILGSEGVTEIGALYKVSPSKFVLVFGSQTEKEKLQNTAIQCRFGESDITLSFHKRIGPLRNGKEPVFVTTNLPEHVSDQAVRLAFSHFGEVVSVLKVRHKFNRKIRNGKRHVRVFPAGGDPAILPRKIAFHGCVSRDVLFAEKVVLSYRCKTRHMLGENCPVVSPTSEDFDMSYTEQSETPRDNKTPEKTDSSVGNQPPAESRQESSSVEEELGEDGSSTDGTGGDSDSGLSSASSEEDGSVSVSSVPETPLKKPITSASPKNLAANQHSNDSTKSTHSSDARSITETNKKSLRDFEIPNFDGKLNHKGFIDRIMRKHNLTVNKSAELAKEVLSLTLGLLDNKTSTEYWNIFTSYFEPLRKNYSIGSSRRNLDNFLYKVAEEVRPDIISETDNLVISRQALHN